MGRECKFCVGKYGVEETSRGHLEIWGAGNNITPAGVRSGIFLQSLELDKEGGRMAGKFRSLGLTDCSSTLVSRVISSSSLSTLKWRMNTGIEIVHASSFLGGSKSRGAQISSLDAQLRLLSEQQFVWQIRAANEGTRWWQKGGPSNMRDVNSTQEFLDNFANAEEKLVVVEFFATWCGTCRALHPKLCQIAAEHPGILFLKVNFEANRTMCRSLNVKILPLFHFYRGSQGRLDAFSCSISKLQKLRDAIVKHNTDRCSIGPMPSLADQFNHLD